MRLVDFLSDNGAAFEHVAYAPMSAALGPAVATLEIIPIKAEIIVGSSDCTLCALGQDRSIDLIQIARIFSSGTVRLASEDESEELFRGYNPGYEPPIGALFGMRTVMDESLSCATHVILPLDQNEGIKLRRDEWERLCRAQVARITPSPAVDNSSRAGLENVSPD